MIKKLNIAVAVFAMVTSCAWATRTWSTSAYYPGSPSGSVTENDYFSSGTIFTATMSGVGSGGGAAYAIDVGTGTMYAFVNTGGGPGQPFYATNTGSALTSATTVGIRLNISVGSTGAYGTASVSSNW